MLRLHPLVSFAAATLVLPAATRANLIGQVGDPTDTQTQQQVALEHSEADLAAAISAEDSGHRHKVLDNTAVAYRLNILGGLFSNQEKAELSIVSKVVGASRELARAASAGHAAWSQRGALGSEYARGVGTAVVTAADATGSAWNPLTTWMTPRGSVSGALANQMAPMIWDLSEKSRAPDWNGVSVWEKSVVLLPSGGSLVQQLEFAEAKVLFQSAVSGNWPSFGRLQDLDYERFGKVWLRRIANVAVAGCVAELLTPKVAKNSTAHFHGPPPVTLNYRF